MTVLVITGTGTEVGKTVVTAAVAATAAAAGRSVAVLKPAQTGVGPDEPGDAAEVARLAGGEVSGVGRAGGGRAGGAPSGGFVTAFELARYPEPLAPDTAARRAGLPAVRPHEVAEAAEKLAASHDLVLVEGAGGLLVRFDPEGGTLADTARLLDAPVLVVARAGLGTLNETALTAEALRSRRIGLLGVVVGSWPREPGLAARCNVADLPGVAGAPLLGAVPEGAPAVSDFRTRAGDWLSPRLGGRWDAAAFAADVG